jgi:filamentous hemagglutinin family protein
MNKILKHCLSVSNTTFLFLISTMSAEGQITPDGSTPTNINQTDSVTEITGGTEAGSNLFHSFDKFSVGTGETAFFNNANSVENIFSRVTGGNISNIDGLIRANGTANLFLINPAGIIFGENASLNIGGSFLGSTADSIVFPDGEFSATDLDNPPLIAINAPIGLNFREEAGEIVNQSFVEAENELVGRFTIGDSFTAGLQVPPGKTLALVGGNVILDGGSITVNEGNIELGAVGENSFVGITFSDNQQNFTLNYDRVQNFQDISLFSGAIVDTSGDVGGAINLHAKNIELTGETLGTQETFPVFIFSNTVGEGTGGNIAINASDNISLSGDFTNIATEAEGSGVAGNIIVNTKTLNMTGGTAISSASFLSDNSQAGDVIINALDLVELSGSTSNLFFNTTIATPGSDTGSGGDIVIETNKLLVKDGAQIFASTFGEGDSGNVNIIANSIELAGESESVDGVFTSGIFAQVEEDATTGNGGNLTIETEQLSVSDGAQISTAARNDGQGGNLSINAADSIVLSGFSAFDTTEAGRSGIFVSAEEGATQNAGTLNLNTGQLIVENGARISADNRGIGEGGDANINVSELIIRDGGEIGAGSLVDADAQSDERGAGGTLTINATESVEIFGTGDINGEPVNSSLFTLAEGTGDAGDLNLTTNSLSIGDGGRINASSTGTADAGNIQIQASSINISDNTSELFSGIFAEVAEGAEGKGGNIDIAAEEITVSGTGGNISVGNFGVGDAGNLSIATNNLNVTEGAQVSASTFGEGDAGDLNITAQESVTVSGGEDKLFTGIFAQVNPGAIGNGGNFTLETPRLSILSNGRIQASTFGRGNAGQLNITASIVEVIDTPDENFVQTGIFAEVAGGAEGKGGNINLAAEEITVSGTEGRISVGNFGIGRGGNLTITTNKLAVESGAQISSSTFAQGDAGNVAIKAQDSVTVIGDNSGSVTGLFAQVNPGAIGNGKNLTIETPNLSILNGGKVQVSTFGEGNAGRLTITANNIEIAKSLTQNITNDTGIFAQVDGDATGNGGDVNLKTNNLSLRNGGEVSVATFGKGNAGELSIIATDRVEVLGTSLEGENSQITVDANKNSSGRGGNLFLQAANLTLDKGQITATTASESGGSITLDIAENITLRNNSLISAKATGAADGGNLTIDTRFIIANPNQNSDILASAEEGKGGNIKITAESLLGIEPRNLNSTSNDINASSQNNVDGTISIETPEVNSLRTNIEVEQDVVSPDTIVSQGCYYEGGVAQNSFVVKGRGGMPPEPTQPFDIGVTNVENNTSNTSDLQTNLPATEPTETKETEAKNNADNNVDNFVPARGIILKEDGTIILTAYPTPGTPGYRAYQQKIGCQPGDKS